MILDFVSPARAPGFRFGFGEDVFFFGILMVITKTLGRRKEGGAPYESRDGHIIAIAQHWNSATIYPDNPPSRGGAALRSEDGAGVRGPSTPARLPLSRVPG